MSLLAKQHCFHRVKGLDQKALPVNFYHPGFAHVECVGDEETILASDTGNKQFHLSEPGAATQSEKRHESISSWKS